MLQCIVTLQIIIIMSPYSESRLFSINWTVHAFSAIPEPGSGGDVTGAVCELGAVPHPAGGGLGAEAARGRRLHRRGRRRPRQVRGLRLVEAQEGKEDQEEEVGLLYLL